MRLYEMMTFDEKTLDFFRSLLATGKPAALGTIYEHMNELQIPQGQERLLFNDLLPEIVEWFEKCTLSCDKDAVALNYLQFVETEELIEEEGMTSLIPFIRRIFANNKDAVMKKLLTVLRDGELTLTELDFIKKFGINWPELDVIKNSLEIGSRPSRTVPMRVHPVPVR